MKRSKAALHAAMLSMAANALGITPAELEGQPASSLED